MNWAIGSSAKILVNSNILFTRDRTQNVFEYILVRVDVAFTRESGVSTKFGFRPNLERYR